jgi:putative flippase GtrA
MMIVLFLLGIICSLLLFLFGFKLCGLALLSFVIGTLVGSIIQFWLES